MPAENEDIECGATLPTPANGAHAGQNKGDTSDDQHKHHHDGNDPEIYHRKHHHHKHHDDKKKKKKKKKEKKTEIISSIGSMNKEDETKTMISSERVDIENLVPLPEDAKVSTNIGTRRLSDPLEPREGRDLVWKNVSMVLSSKDESEGRKLLDNVFGEVPRGQGNSFINQLPLKLSVSTSPPNPLLSSTPYCSDSPHGTLWIRQNVSSQYSSRTCNFERKNPNYL